MTERSVWIGPEGVRILHVPRSGDLELAAAGFSKQPLDPNDPGKVYAIVRNPLQRFQEFHRVHWIENHTGDLPPALKAVGFQRDWPIAMVAGHVAALALAEIQSPGIAPLGEYSPQVAFYGDTRPELLVYDFLPLEFRERVPGSPDIKLAVPNYKFSPAAVIGDLKSRLESAYAADIALYHQHYMARAAEVEQLRAAIR